MAEGSWKRLLPQEWRGRQPPMDFVLATVGRSGSDYLAELLSSHPAVDCRSEVFHPAGSERWHYAVSEQVGPINHLYRLAAERDADLGGFKLTTNCTAHRPELGVLAPRMARRLVVVDRRNVLSLIVSAELANASGVFHSKYGAGTYGDTRVELRADELPRRIRGYHRELDDFVGLFGDMSRFRITYDGDFARRDLAGLQRFLGVPEQDLTATARRMRGRPMAEVVSNWEEVSETLRGTDLEVCLQEEPVGA